MKSYKRFGSIALVLSIVMSHFSVLALDDVYEPNDAHADAVELIIDGGSWTSTYAGLVANNEDWFKATSTVDGFIHVSVDFDHSDGDIQLALYDAIETQLIASATTNDQENAFVPVSIGDVVYIRVYNGGADQEYSITLTYDDEYERAGGGNNTVGDADVLGFNPTLSARFPALIANESVLFAMDDDFYKFTPTLSNSIVILVVSDDPSSTFEIDSVVNLSSVTTRSGTGWTEVHGRTTGSSTVSFRVRSVSAADNIKYYLRLYGDDTYDNGAGNDTRATATDINVLSGNRRTRSNCVNLDADYFKFTLGVATPIAGIVQAYDLGEAMRIELLDSVGAVIADDQNDEYAAVSGVLSAGDYYYRVSSAGMSARAYLIHHLIEDTNENNDTFATATDMDVVGIGVNKTVPWQVHDDADYYCFSASADETLAVVATTVGNLGDVSIDLYDQTGSTVIASSVKPGIGFTKNILTLSATSGLTYSFKMNSPVGVVLVSSAIGIYNDDGDSLVSGGNHTRATATDMTAGLIATGRFDRTDQRLFDDDFYTFTFPDDAAVKVLVNEFLNTHSNIDLELQDSLGNPVASSATTNDEEEILYIFAANETYYVRIYGDLSDGYDLSVTIDDIYEPNNNASANNIREELSTSKEILLDAMNFLVARDDDFYFVNADRNGNMSVQILFDDIAGTNNLNLEIHTIDGGTVATSATSATAAGQREFVTFATTAGTNYVIYVYEAAASYGQYDTYRLAAAYDDNYENNDTSGTAWSIPSVTTLNSLIALDADWFVLNSEGTPPAGDYYIRIDFTGVQGDLDLDVLDGALASVGTLTSSTNYEYVKVTFDGAQDYSVHISFAGYPNLGPYNLTILRDDSYEQNDTIGTSAVITRDVRVEDLVFVSDDDDWYSIAIAAGDFGKELWVETGFTHTDGDLSLALWNPAHTIQLATADSATDDEVIYYAIPGGGPAGNYKIKVSALSSATYHPDYSVVAGVSGLTLSSTGGNAVTEGGADDAFTIRLNTRPTDDVTVTLSNLSGDVDLTPNVIVFTSANWDTPVSVVISANDNFVQQSSPRTANIGYSTTSLHAAYNGLSDLAATTVDITDNDTANVTRTETSGSTAVSETGPTSDKVFFVLDTQPTADVIITLTIDTAQATLDASTLTFTSLNWSSSQSVVVTAVDDNLDETDPHTITLTAAIASGDSFYNALADIDTTVSISDNNYTLTVNAGSNGSITVPSTSTTVVTHGIAEPIVASPAAGYHFDGWTVTAGTATIDDSNAASTTITMTTGSATVEAAFAINVYQLTVNSDANGSILLPALSPTPATHAVAVDISATNAVGYHFVNWTVTSGTAAFLDENNRNTKVTLTSGNATVQANFAINIYQLAVVSGGNGSILEPLASPVSATHGDTIDISASAITGFHFSEWQITSGSATIANLYAPVTTIVLQSGDATVQAVFLSNQYQLTINAGANGTILLPALSPTTVTHNVPVSISATGNFGYHFDGWTVPTGSAAFGDSSDAATTATLSFGDATIQANFTPNIYSLSVTATVLQATETGSDGEFRFTLSGTTVVDVTVCFIVSGTATDGTDFASLGTSVVIPAGFSTTVVSVSALQDVIVEPAETIVLTLSASAGYHLSAMSAATVSVVDDDVAGWLVSPLSLSVSEGGAAQTVSVCLISEPISDVVVSIGGGSGELTLSPSVLTFTSINWNSPVSVSVSAVNDMICEPTEVYTLTLTATSTAHGYDSLSDTFVAATVIDNDPAGWLVSPLSLSVTEGGVVQTVAISLSSEPSADVVVTISGGSGELTLSPSVLTFTSINWNVPASVSVSAVNDLICEQSEANTLTLTASSTAFGYDSLSDTFVTATVIDNDPAGLVVYETLPLAISESGTGSTLSIALLACPADDVVVFLSDTTGMLTTVPASLTFTPGNWNISQSAVVSVIDNLFDEGISWLAPLTLSTSSSAFGYATLASTIISCEIIDNDVAGVLLSATALSVSENGMTDTVSICLSSSPYGTIVVSLSDSSSQLVLSPSVLTFTSLDWNVSQTIIVSAIDDSDAEGAHTALVSLSVSALSATDVAYAGLSDVTINVTIDDNDVPLDATPFIIGLRVNSLSVSALTDSWRSLDVTTTDVGSELYAGIFNESAGGLELELRRPATGYSLAALSDTALPRTELRYVLDMSGTWFARIVGHDLSTTQTYDLMIAFDDSYEDNDLSASTAAPFAFASVEQSLVLTDDDWYAFTVSETGPVFIGLFAEYDIACDLVLYDPSGSVILSDSTASTVASQFMRLWFDLSETGEYSLKLSASEAYPNYTLAILRDDNSEDNDDFASAALISVNERLNDRVWIDMDYYQFTVSDTSVSYHIGASLSTTDGNMALDLSVYDVAESLIDWDSSFFSGALLGIDITFSETGIYFIEIGDQNVHPGYDVYVIADDPSESGTGDDLPNLATSIILPYDGTGSITDDDWYSFTLSETGPAPVFVGLFFATADGNLDLYVTDPSGSVVLAQSTTATDNETLWFDPSSSGTYLVQVTGGPFQPQYRLVVAQDDRYEDNDSLVTAASVALFAEETGLVFLDEDWYSFTLSDTGRDVVVSAAFSHADGNIDVSLLSASGVVLATAVTLTDNESVVFTPSETGLYYVQIVASPLNLQYGIRIIQDDDSEDNDTSDDAAILAMRSVLKDRVLADEDWYAFSTSLVPVGDIDPVIFVEVDYTVASGAVGFEIISVSSSAVVATGVLDAANSTLTARFTPPTASDEDFLIRVFGDLVLDYRVLVTYEDNDDLRTAGNDTAANAVDIGASARDNLSLTDEDWYRIDVSTTNRDLTVILTFSNAQGNIDADLCVLSGTVVNVILSATSLTDGETLTVNLSTTGEWLLRIYGENNPSYSLYVIEQEAEEQNDGNDLPETAGVLPLNTWASASWHNDDWWRVELSSLSGTYPVFVAVYHNGEPDGDLSMELYDLSGSLVLSALGGTNNSETMVYDPSTTAAFLIRVAGDAPNAAYRIVAVVDDLLDLSGSGNDRIDLATTVFTGATYSGLVCLDDDWYSFTPTGAGWRRLKSPFSTP
ncbi:MAG: hypothetical protein ABIH86_06890 [Planctomycetota bacterium]